MAGAGHRLGATCRDVNTTSRPRVNDTEAMDWIAANLNKLVWTPDTLDLIADIVRQTGREVLDSHFG